MCAVVFIFLAVAWLVDQCIRSYYRQFRTLGVTITFVILVVLFSGCPFIWVYPSLLTVIKPGCGLALGFN